eukprot:tig00021428_g21146.t1
MAASASGEREIQARFVTKLSSIRVADVPISLPRKLTRLGLSEVINHLLSLDPQRSFDFLIDGEFLRTSLDRFLTKKGLSGEAVITIEYVESVPKPKEAAEAKHDDWVSSLACAAGLVLAGSYDGAARVYSPEMELRGTLAGAHAGPIRAVCWVAAPDTEGAGPSEGQGPLTCATASKDCTAVLWSGTVDGEWRARAALKGHGDSVEAVCASPDQSMVATGSWDKTIRLWAAALGPEEAGKKGPAPAKRKKRRGEGADEAPAPPAEERVRTRPAGPARRGAEGRWGAGGAGVLRGARAGGDGVAWPAPGLLFSASWDHTVRQWDVETGSCTATLTGAKAALSLSVSPQSGLLATGGSDPTAGRCCGRSWGGSGWAAGVAWAPHRAHLLASASYDGSLRLWDIRARTPLHSLPAHEEKALCVAWLAAAPGARRLASGGADGRVKAHSLDASGEE